MGPSVTQYWGAEPHRKQKKSPFLPNTIGSQIRGMCREAAREILFVNFWRNTFSPVGLFTSSWFCQRHLFLHFASLLRHYRDRRDHLRMRRVNDYDFHFLGVWGIFKPFLSIPQTTYWKIAVRTFRSKRLADKVGGDRKTTKLPKFHLVLWCKTSFPKSRSLELFWVVG